MTKQAIVVTVFTGSGTRADPYRPEIQGVSELEMTDVTGTSDPAASITCFVRGTAPAVTTALGFANTALAWQGTEDEESPGFPELLELVTEPEYRAFRQRITTAGLYTEPEFATFYGAFDGAITRLELLARGVVGQRINTQRRYRKADSVLPAFFSLVGRNNPDIRERLLSRGMFTQDTELDDDPRPFLDLDRGGPPDTDALLPGTATDENISVTQDADSINVDKDGDGVADLVIPKP